ncbi:MAG: GNAT family N-acetyltransferase [Clostridiales bacterium]|nr:GNAT family N-acetyltransferase [Clostridiales bacterium]
MRFTLYNDNYKNELNSWQAKERLKMLTGLDDFVVVKGTLLGDYLQMIDREMQTVCLLAFDNKRLIGFVCYEKKDKGEYHIEIMGVNPDLRGRGYCKKMLILLKEILSKNQDFAKLSLSVNVKNEFGKKAFAKVCNQKGISKNPRYVEYEIK